MVHEIFLVVLFISNIIILESAVLGAVKKKKEVEQDSSASEIKHSSTTSECSNNETGTIDTFVVPEINVKDEGILKAADIMFMTEAEDHNTNPVEEPANILPLGR